MKGLLVGTLKDPRWFSGLVLLENVRFYCKVHELAFWLKPDRLAQRPMKLVIDWVEAKGEAMTNRKRERSVGDVYHVMQRGVGLFDVFEDDEDRETYLGMLKGAIRLNRAEQYAWCLMSNHTHLLLHVEFDRLSDTMQRVGSRYAVYFNRRHARPGHLFQGPFASVAVNDDEQLLTALRYIHLNPRHHDERVESGSYPWSSFREYTGAGHCIASTGFALGLLGGVDEFVRFHEGDSDQGQLDTDSFIAIDDDEAREIARCVLSEAGFAADAAHVGELDRLQRDAALRSLKDRGFSLRRIQRLTGISFNAVRNA